MAVLTEGKHSMEGLISEANGYRSRENKTVTVYAGLVYPAMLPLAEITATGKLVPVDLDATTPTDGTEAAIYVLLDELSGGEADGDQVAAVIARDAEFNKAEMAWFKYDLSAPDGMEALTEGNIDTVEASLLTVGILLRPGI